MICPKCGNEIAEGHLYCEVCGEEIQMVPDFDIQVEESINVSLSTVAGDVNKPVIDEETINSYTTKELPVDKINDSLHGETNTSDYLKNILKKIPTAWLVLGAAIFVVIIMSLFIALRSFSEPSVPENTYAKARKLYDAGDYTRTIETLRNIIDSDDWDYNCAILLSDSYMELHKFDEAIAILSQFLDDDPDRTDVLRRLMEAYIAAEDMTSVENLLKDTTNQEILSSYSSYLAKAPVFSMDSGNYTDDNNLTIISENNDAIYYTLDGSIPNEASNKYEVPFVFDVGEHVVTAICVNQYGILSEPVQKNYVIEKKYLDEPVLLTAGGKYSDPELIKLEKPSNAVIYYTDDGSDPGADSNVYNQPIPMPLREKTYKFIMINADGVTSQVVEATYNLQMVTLVDVPSAEAAVQFLLKLGNKGVKQSEYKGSSAYRFNNNNYYLIEEFSSQTSDTVKTGRVFAVDVLSGEVYKFDMSSADGDYQLQPLG